MITNQHNDGGCFKLTVNYIKGEGEQREYVMYGEDENELWTHYLEVKHIFDYVYKITIMDDSK